jgi:multimeric flavodoxin WrbA
MKNVLILSSSPRKGGNTDMLCDAFAKGAKEAGNKVTKIRVADKKIGYCMACYACQKTGKCAIKDDAAAILKKMLVSDVIVFGAPAYFYSCPAQLKALFDRSVAIYPNLTNKQYYYLMAQGDENKEMFAGTIKSLDGFLDCFEGSKLKGMVAAPGIYEKGDIKGTKYITKAYKLGLKVK